MTQDNELITMNKAYTEIEEKTGITFYSVKRATGIMSAWLTLSDFSMDRPSYLALVGFTGVGKTSGVKQLASLHPDWYLLPLRLANMDLGQIGGYPTPDATTWAIRLSILDQYKVKIEEAKAAGKKLLIFFDEINRAPKEILRALFNLLDEKVWGGYALPKDTAFIAGMNPAGEVHDVFDIFKEEAALNSRFLTIGMKHSVPELRAYLKSKGASRHDAVSGFLDINPDRAFEYEEMMAGKKFATPAFWEYAASFLASGVKSGRKLKDMLEDENVSSLLGSGMSPRSLMMFAAYVKENYQNNMRVNARTILEDYDSLRYLVQEGKSLDASGTALDGMQLLSLAKGAVRILASETPDLNTNPHIGANIVAFLSDIGDEPLLAFKKALVDALGSESVYLGELSILFSGNDALAARLVDIQTGLESI